MELFHFTCMEHLDSIVNDMRLKLADSNLMVGRETAEDIAAVHKLDKAQETTLPDGRKAYNYVTTVDEKKVVWLTRNPICNSTVLNWAKYSAVDKTRLRITVDIPIERAHKWTRWYDANSGSKFYYELMKNSSTDRDNWYVCEEEISILDWVEIRDMVTNTVLWRRRDVTEPVTRDDINRAVEIAHWIGAQDAKIVVMSEQATAAYDDFLVDILHNAELRQYGEDYEFDTADYLFLFMHPQSYVLKDKGNNVILGMYYKFQEPTDAELRCDVCVLVTSNQDELSKQRWEDIVGHQSTGELVTRAGKYHAAPHMHQYVWLRAFLDTPCAAAEPRNSPTAIQLPGKHRKRVEKSNVSVVVYRRPERPYGSSERSGEGRKLDHQVAVSGHYRNQWYPATKSHKRIFIADHVKGPDTGVPPPIRIIKAVR